MRATFVGRTTNKFVSAFAAGGGHSAHIFFRLVSTGHTLCFLCSAAVNDKKLRYSHAEYMCTAEFRVAQKTASPCRWRFSCRGAISPRLSGALYQLSIQAGFTGDTETCPFHTLSVHEILKSVAPIRRLSLMGRLSAPQLLAQQKAAWIREGCSVWAAPRSSANGSCGPAAPARPLADLTPTDSLPVHLSPPIILGRQSISEMNVGVIIAIVLILIFACCVVRARAKAPSVAVPAPSQSTTAPPAASDGFTPAPPPGQPIHARDCRCPKCAENLFRADNLNSSAENFSAAEAIAGSCAEDDKLQYAVYEYGAPGVSYAEYASAQAIDPQVVKNHQEYLRDRANNPQIKTGRTLSVDSHESYDYMPWQGIRGRPQAVPIGAPDQEPDVNLGVFAKKQRLTWSSQ